MEPPDVGGLVVGWIRLTIQVSAAKRVVQVLGVVPVHMDGRFGDVHPHQLLDLTEDPRLLQDLSLRRLRWMLAGIDDARHRRPRAIVGSTNQQDFTVPHDDRRDARQPKQVMADPFAQA